MCGTRDGSVSAVPPLRCVKDSSGIWSSSIVLDVTVDEYIEMIRLKTSVLLAAALKIGAILGGAPEKDAQLLYDFGIKMGLAFQLQDDYLDVYGDPAVFGKKIGGDILCNKKTFMLITALSLSEGEDKETLLNWLRAIGLRG